jgi:hypothetical protein
MQPQDLSVVINIFEAALAESKANLPDPTVTDIATNGETPNGTPTT